MKRRLTFAMLLTAVVALVLSGLGTLVLARFGTRRTAEENLRTEVETSAALVKLGQTRNGQVDAQQFSDLEALVCARNATLTERQRALLCGGGQAPLTSAKQQLCQTNTGVLVKLAVPAAMAAARTALCNQPSSETLDGVKHAWCSSLDPSVTAGRAAVVARQITFALRAFCQAIGSALPQSSSFTALADEPVDLLVFDAQQQLVSGSLPDGVTLADLRVDDLRQGSTVSGRLRAGTFAAAPVDASSTDLEVVIAARQDESAAGLLPWFLIASALTLLIGAVIVRTVSRSLVAPLHQATAVTAQIAAGELGVRLPEPERTNKKEPDEIEALGHSINEMAEALQLSRGAERQFILSVSHDLRTPLTSIRGYAEAIADGATEPAAAAAVILTESRRLERLVADLLQLGMLDAHQFGFHPVDVDLNEVAGESVDAFRREVEQSGLALVWQPAERPWPVRVDPDRLGQVMANVVENATKFAAHQITVTVVGDAARPRLEIRDDGPGIPDADLPHLFDRLYVASNRPVRKQVGTGLGLAIAHEMVQAMGGRILISNDPGGGARVTIELVAP